jgi:hypothetical protein
MTVIQWLWRLTELSLLMVINIKVMKARLTRLEEEVRDLKQQISQP